MAEGFGVPYPYWLASSPPHHPASAPLFLANHTVESYDLTQGWSDPIISHGSYYRSPADLSNNPLCRENSRSQMLSSPFCADNSRLGNCGPRGEDYMVSPNGFHPLRESSSDVVPFPTENISERRNLNFLPTYNSATSAPSAPVPSLAEMLIKKSQEPFYKPITPSAVYASTNALDGYNRPESMYFVPGPPVEPYICVTDSMPSLPSSSLETQALLTQTGIHLGDGGSFCNNSEVCSHAPENIMGVQSSLHGSSVEPVNFNLLLGYGVTTGHIKPLSENPDPRHLIVGSPGLKSPQSSHPLQFNSKASGSLFDDKLERSGASSLYQRPNTTVADRDSGVSESSLKNAVEDLNSSEPRSWSHFTVCSEGPSAPTLFSMGSESCGTMKLGNGNAQSALNYKASFEGRVHQPSEDVQSNQKPCKLQEQRFDIMNRDKKTTLTDLGFKESSRSNADDISTGQTPEAYLCHHGDFQSPSSSPRVSSVVNAMHNLSEVLVYECFNNGSWLKMEQLENLDKVVDNLTKCLKKITGNSTIAREASLPTHAMDVSCPNVVNLNEAPKGVAKDFQGFNVKPLDNCGFKETVTQSIKNVLASNFPDGGENNPQTLLYKNLWLETEAALCSTTCMARYHRIKNQIGSLKLHNREISADASTFVEEPSLNPQKSAPIVNTADQETTESFIKQGNNCDSVVTKSHDAPQSSRFNSDPVDAVLSFMSRSLTSGLEQTIHGNIKPDAALSGKIADATHEESPASTKENECNDVIDRFQILKHQETMRKLNSQNCPETKMSDHEYNPEASEMARLGKSSHVSDVMGRFQILKRREAEQVQKSLNSVDIDSDSDNDQPRNKTQNQLASMMTGLGEFNPQIETCVDTEPSASGNGYESSTSDWEHVLKDD